MTVPSPSSSSPLSQFGYYIASLIFHHTATLLPFWQACRVLPGQHIGSIGLVYEPNVAPSHETHGLFLIRPKALSRQSSFGRSGKYKDSPPSLPRRCQADCRVGEALLVQLYCLSVTAGLPISYKSGPRWDDDITWFDFKSEISFGFVSQNCTG